MDKENRFGGIAKVVYATPPGGISMKTATDQGAGAGEIDGAVGNSL